VSADRGRIRRARPGEAQALTALALRSKAYWPYDEAFMAVIRQVLKISEAEIRAHHVLVHETDGVVDGVGALAWFDGEWEVDHLWVEPAAIGRGIGRLLLDALLARAQRLGAERVLVEADPHAESFYTRRGGRRVGRRASGMIAGRSLPVLEIRL
jgi:GNAT superfamily N-acetyltransferase